MYGFRRLVPAREGYFVQSTRLIGSAAVFLCPAGPNGRAMQSFQAVEHQRPLLQEAAGPAVCYSASGSFCAVGTRHLQLYGEFAMPQGETP